MIAFLAVRRQRDKKKQEVSVQQLNEELQAKQQIQQQILELRKDQKKSGAAGALFFALSLIFFIIAIIILIPALVYGERVFFVAFGITSGTASGLMVLGCCCNDCCAGDNNKGNNDDCLQDEESGLNFEGNEEELQEYPTNITVTTDSGVGSSSVSDASLFVPAHIPVRLTDSPTDVSISLFNNKKHYNNLPTVDM